MALKIQLNPEKLYRIQLKRTKLNEYPSTETGKDPIGEVSGYKVVFGEPVYLHDEYGVNRDDGRLVVGPPLAENTTGTDIIDSPAVKMVSQSLTDPDDSTKTVPIVENGVHYKNKTAEDIVNLTDNRANTIYPITKLSAVQTDGTYDLSEFLLRKVRVDGQSDVTYPSLGYDDNGVYVDDFVPQSTSSIGQTLADIVNTKVSIDNYDAVGDISMGVDIAGVYVRIPGDEAEDLNYMQAYIDAQLNNFINARMTALEGNIYYLQELIKNIKPYHKGATAPADTNKFWIDTTTLTGGLKYCTDAVTNTWNHVPVAYT